MNGKRKGAEHAQGYGHAHGHGHAHTPGHPPQGEAARTPPVIRAVFAAAERSVMTRNFVARTTEAQAGRTPAPMRVDGN